MRIHYLLLILAVVLIACSRGVDIERPDETAPGQEDTAEFPAQEALVWNCEDPRPTRCGNEDDPVCADDGSEYRSSCYACRDSAVLTYTEGPCKEVE